MGEVSLSIDNREVVVPGDATILQAARQAGASIPTLCHSNDLIPASACRICLVEVAGARNLVTACSYPVSAGMKVITDSDRVLKARRLVMELLLSDHPLDCMTCEKAGDCELQDLAYQMGVTGSRFKGEQHHYPVDFATPSSSGITTSAFSVSGASGPATRSRGSRPSTMPAAGSTPK